MTGAVKRIVILNDIAEPKGGATALALLSARSFAERGYAVTYLTGDSGNNPALAAMGVEIVPLGQSRLKSSGFVSALVGGLYNRAAARMVSQWIAANDRPDTVYHLHGWAQILSPSVFGALMPVKDRLVLSAHDFFLACPNGSFSFLKTGQVCPHDPLSMACLVADCDRQNYVLKLWRVARQAIQRLYFDRRHAPPILAIHEGMRPFLMRAGIPSESIHAVPNPATPYSATRIAAEENRQALFVGRLEETKGPDLAAAACREAGVALTIVGDGVMRQQLAAAYPEMTFVGHQSPAAIREHAGRSRVLLMPSRYPEPYGLVATEALWSGLPVILSETALLAADILAAGAGFALEPRHTENFAKALRTMFDDDALTSRMSHAAFAGTRTIGQTPDAWIDALLQHYRNRLDQSVLSEVT